MDIHPLDPFDVDDIKSKLSKRALSLFVWGGNFENTVKKNIARAVPPAKEKIARDARDAHGIVIAQAIDGLVVTFPNLAYWFWPSVLPQNYTKSQLVEFLSLQSPVIPWMDGVKTRPENLKSIEPLPRARVLNYSDRIRNIKFIIDKLERYNAKFACYKPGYAYTPEISCVENIINAAHILYIDLGNIIGRGTYGTIFNTCALSDANLNKCIDYPLVARIPHKREGNKNMLMQQIVTDIVLSGKSPNFNITVFPIVCSPNNIITVMEQAQGDLLMIIPELDTNDAVSITLQVLNAIRAFQREGYVHSDLKLQNILYNRLTKTENVGGVRSRFLIMLTDYDLAYKIDTTPDVVPKKIVEHYYKFWTRASNPLKQFVDRNPDILSKVDQFNIDTVVFLSEMLKLSDKVSEQFHMWIRPLLNFTINNDSIDMLIEYARSTLP